MTERRAMIRLWWLAAAAVAMEGVAIACSCLATDDPAELRRMAEETAQGAVALVEVEALTSFAETGTGEQVHVVRLIAGTAPVRFQIQRGSHPSSGSCDILYERGQRDVVILYPATGATGGTTAYRTSGLCTDLLLDKPVFRDTVAARIGAALGNGERG